MLFSASSQGAEVAVGGIGGGLVAAFQIGLRHHTEQKPELTFSALRPLVSALGELVRDTGRLTGALLTAVFMPPPAGGFRVVPVPSGAVTASLAGRAIAVAAVSLAPNTFVVASGDDDERLVVHRLLDGQEPSQ